MINVQNFLHILYPIHLLDNITFSKYKFLFLSVFLSVLCCLISGCSKNHESFDSPEIEYIESNTVAPSLIWNSKDAGRAGLQAAYPRIITIQGEGANQGYQLATFESYSIGTFSQYSAFPIFLSKDNGANWEKYSLCEDIFKNKSKFYQPYLYELTKPWGEYPSGTILLAGNLLNTHQTNTSIVIYTSTNQGKSFEYNSTVDVGGSPLYDPSAASSTTPIWEPSLIQLDDGTIVCYYSDERMKNKNILQALVHKTSDDGGKTWSSLTLDIGITDKNTRPGMITVTKLPNGQYFACYEVVNKPNLPTYYKISGDGLNWGDSNNLGTLLVDSQGNSIKGQPYCQWIDGINDEPGKLYVSGHTSGKSYSAGSCYMTTTDPENGQWQYAAMPFSYKPELLNGNQVYSPSFCASFDNTRLIHVINIVNDNNYTELLANSIDIRAVKLYSIDAYNIKGIRTNSYASECYEDMHMDVNSVISYNHDFNNSTYTLSLRYYCLEDVTAVMVINGYEYPITFTKGSSKYYYETLIVKVKIPSSNYDVTIRDFSGVVNLEVLSISECN